jgi:hypothetical protein
LHLVGYILERILLNAFVGCCFNHQKMHGKNKNIKECIYTSTPPAMGLWHELFRT